MEKSFIYEERKGLYRKYVEKQRNLSLRISLPLTGYAHFFQTGMI